MFEQRQEDDVKARHLPSDATPSTVNHETVSRCLFPLMQRKKIGYVSAWLLA
jgi:hypothetical protein